MCIRPAIVNLDVSEAKSMTPGSYTLQLLRASLDEVRSRPAE